MENLSRYLAEQFGSEVLYSADRPFVGYARRSYLEKDIRRIKSDFSEGMATFSGASNEAARIARETLGTIEAQEYNPFDEGGDDSTTYDVYDVRDFRYHVAIALVKTTVSNDGKSSASSPVRLIRTRVREEADALFLVDGERAQALDTLLQMGLSQELSVHEFGRYPRWDRDGIIFTFGVAIVKASVR